MPGKDSARKGRGPGGASTDTPAASAMYRELSPDVDGPADATVAGTKVPIRVTNAKNNQVQEIPSGLMPSQPREAEDTNSNTSAGSSSLLASPDRANSTNSGSILRTRSGTGGTSPANRPACGSSTLYSAMNTVEVDTTDENGPPMYRPEGQASGSFAIPPSAAMQEASSTDLSRMHTAASIHTPPLTPQLRSKHVLEVAKFQAARERNDTLLNPNAFSHPHVDTQHALERPNQFSFDSGTAGIAKFLQTVPHLYTLPYSELLQIAAATLRREFDVHDDIIQTGDKVKHVYVVLSGAVEVFVIPNSVTKAIKDNKKGKNPTSNWAESGHAAVARGKILDRIGTVDASGIFCMDNIVFEEHSGFFYRAGAKQTTLGLIPASIFMAVLDRNVPLRQSIGRKLADHMDIFICFKDFCRHLFSHESAKHEYLPIWHILEAYAKLNNSIHTKMRSEEIDTGAWGYAIKRLPENVTTTFCFDLARALPPFLANRMRTLAKGNDRKKITFEGDVKFINTKERRRCSWQLGMPGKTLVLLRDGFTDLIDFMTMLCIHIIESNKLRGRLQGMVHPPAIDIIDEVLYGYGDSSTSKGQTPTNAAPPGNADEEAAKVAKNVLQKMPLSERERQGLLKIWPTTCLQSLYSVIMHREEYMLRVDSSVGRRYQTDPFHEWGLNLRAAVMKKMGLSPQGHLPPDLQIDIISSNTHCTKSCLSPFARVHRERILEFGRTKKPELVNLTWPVEEDLVYACISSYVAENNLKEEYNKALMGIGLEVMEDTAMTGLQVDIVPVHLLNMELIDPCLKVRGCEARGTHHFILNMDFAFGCQADGITKTLVETFGKHIMSFNVMGKAGGIASQMNRGDIQLASHVLLSKSSLTTEDFLDELRSCGNEDVSVEFLNEMLGGDKALCKVLHGPVLTIPGTMLQNEKLLKYYSNIWHCIGLEMEGSYFCRQVKESLKKGLLIKNIRTRFAYYTSDLPLRSDASLSTPMRPNEGVPPLYAIARAFLCRILARKPASPVITN